MRSLFNKQSGFTLVEMIMVIVITGIIGGMVAVFLKAPIQQYMDVARRAELTDIADTAVRRMARDVRIAVPNSVRAPTTCTSAPSTPCAVEFLPTKDGGRYRAGTPGNMLFATNNGVFDIIGPASTMALVSGDYIVVGSTQSDGSLPYNTTPSGILRAFTSLSGQTVTMNNTPLPANAELPSQRFDVVDGTQQAVTYACEGSGTDANGNGVGRLNRYWRYGFYTPNTSQPVPPIMAQAPIPGTNVPEVQSAILADKVSACTIDYDAVNQRFGLLAVRLTLTSNNESVTLYNEIHVNNAP